VPIMGLLMVRRLAAGASAAFGLSPAGAAAGATAAACGAAAYTGAACAGAATTWVIFSSFCLMVTRKSFCSMVSSPIFDLLTILINSWICLKSMFFNLIDVLV